MLCICFKAAHSNLSSAAGQRTAVRLRCSVTSSSCHYYCRQQKVCSVWNTLCRKVHLFHKETKTLTLQSTELYEQNKAGGFWVAFWQPNRHLLSGWFCSLDFETSPCIFPVSYEIFLYAKFRFALFAIV